MMWALRFFESQLESSGPITDTENKCGIGIEINDLTWPD